MNAITEVATWDAPKEADREQKVLSKEEQAPATQRKGLRDVISLWLASTDR